MTDQELYDFANLFVSNCRNEYTYEEALAILLAKLEYLRYGDTNENMQEYWSEI
jgi:hypothetical protein